jgi:hypothetical protein
MVLRGVHDEGDYLRCWRRSRMEATRFFAMR